jgi:transposase
MKTPPATEAEIQRLYHAERWKVRTIATHLNVHHDVVRRVLGTLPPRAHRRRSAPGTPGLPTRLDPFKDFIDTQLASYPRLCATRLFDMLKGRGYAGSLRTLRKHVARVRPTPKKEAFLRLSTLPGEEAQADWAYVGKVAVPGGERSLWLFVMVLSYSRALWGEFVYELTADSLCRSLVRAASFFGGCTRQWLFDNAKAVVLERHAGTVRFHPDLLHLAGVYHVQPRLCAVGKGNEKGRVERQIRFLRDRFLAARAITGIESGNRELLAFLTDIAYPRPHTEHKEKSVAQVLAEERERLLPLPVSPPATHRQLAAQVDKTASVHFDTNRYSVPARYAQSMLTLVVDDTHVRLLDQGTEVAFHDRSWGRRQNLELAGHREEILAHKRAAHDLKGRDRLRALIPAIDELYARWLDSGRHIGAMTARALKLLDLYGDTLFVEAVHVILARGLHDPGALAQLLEQKRRASQRRVPVDLTFASHVPDTEVIPHNLEDYDAKPES